MIFFFFSCLIHKTNLTGVVDHKQKDSCSIEIKEDEIIFLTTDICRYLKEGDTVKFYVRKK